MQAGNVLLNPKSVLPKILDYAYNNPEPKQEIISDKVLKFYNASRDMTDLMDKVSQVCNVLANYIYLSLSQVLVS